MKISRICRTLQQSVNLQLEYLRRVE